MPASELYTESTLIVSELKKQNERGKVYATFIRQDVLEVSLYSISDFLPWYDQLLSVMAKCGDSLDQNILLSQIKKSVKNIEDVNAIKNMTASFISSGRR